MIGQTISQYKITAKLGAGGMGEVYLATDSKLHREVALKFLPQQFSNDPDARSRFQREARALAALNHPNIVTVHDVSEYDGQPFIAMEYLRGKSLKDIISEGDIALERVIDFAYQTAQGLAAAHKAEVVHRDVKSENIIVSPEGRVKIMDFGLATWRGVTQITKEGSTVGTMSYMSPEQAQGKDVDQRTDLWSLGVVLYEMLTGRLPFQGDHEAAVVYAIVQDTPQPPLRYRSGIPSGLDEIVTKALEKDPETRYQTATGFLSDITRFRKASEASLAGTSTTSHAKAPKRSLLPLVISVATVIALVVFKPWQSGSSRDESQPSAVKTLVVLPFENLGGSEDEYFADGITEEITSRLARIAGLRVISRTSAIQYKGTNKRLRQIGDELGVAYVLEGTIRWDKSGDTNRVRITPQLIKVEDDFHIWTEVY